ncbi:threonine efflux protein [Klebsiella michiganensis]|uniref:Threonine efflux protein n=1 Tax=Klebsiella michiganensis TaxID=1134687 RepID=A0A7H4MYV0_9ENTR|nr:threonine efflux protein [Klebsiella michiganensis]
MSVADSLLAYSFAALLLTLTPGLDTALILRTATVEGGKKAFQAALGIDTGCFIWGGCGRLRSWGATGGIGAGL